MHKRFLRIDLEYDMDDNPAQLLSFVVLKNIAQILEEDMPYVTILYSKDAPTRDSLDDRSVVN